MYVYEENQNYLVHDLYLRYLEVARFTKFTRYIYIYIYIYI